MIGEKWNKLVAVPMSDAEKARKLFLKAGLTFPAIPAELAEKLREREKWVFATRELSTSPYNLREYVEEAKNTHLEDYAVLAHSGHGVNSYALQYYLVHGALRMFLHLAWGGVYMNEGAEAKKIRNCFLLADEVVAAAGRIGEMLPADGYLLVVGSDSHGSYWLPPGRSEQKSAQRHDVAPAAVLTEALQWMQNSARGVSSARQPRSGERWTSELVKGD